MFEIQKSKTAQGMIDIVLYYNDNCEKLTPALLISLQDKLTAKSVYFVAEVAQSIYEADNAELNRKVGIGDSIHVLVGEGQTVTAAKEMAIRDQQDKRDIENQNIAQATYYKQLLNQINKVLSAMQQRISYKKIEYGKANIQQ